MAAIIFHGSASTFYAHHREDKARQHQYGHVIPESSSISVSSSHLHQQHFRLHNLSYLRASSSPQLSSSTADFTCPQKALPTKAHASTPTTPRTSIINRTPQSHKAPLQPQMAAPLIPPPALPSKTHFLAHMLQPSLPTDPFRGPTCPICHEEYTPDPAAAIPPPEALLQQHPIPHNAVRILPCNHIFGEPCLRRWLDTPARPNRCMFCRVVLFAPEGNANPRRAPALAGEGVVVRPRVQWPPRNMEELRELLELGVNQQRLREGLDADVAELRMEQRLQRPGGADEGAQRRVRGLLDQLLVLREAMDAEEERVGVEQGGDQEQEVQAQRQEIGDLREAEPVRQRVEDGFDGVRERAARERQRLRRLMDEDVERQRREQELAREQEVLGQQRQQVDHANERLREMREIGEIIQGLRQIQEGMVARDLEGWALRRLRVYESLFTSFVAVASLVLALGFGNVVRWVDGALRDWGRGLMAISMWLLGLMCMGLVQYVQLRWVDI
ncbi:hypothetical protein BU16DRAFT_565002 [Lophium mytilinum]|uniref:RING-type domain-containing protein n=1 Tax=Lophium mytilinum TaxID=390894 RepID=A0A6A6QFW1_9PEZI|nr:hypothetical protein BU16DRAFT_565002 [Lophium mytilinum]